MNISNDIREYITLLDDKELYPIIRNNLKQSYIESIPMLQQAIHNPFYADHKDLLILLYNDLNSMTSTVKIENYTYKDYISLRDIFIEYVAYLFDLSYYETPLMISKLLDPIVAQLKQKITWRSTSDEIINWINHEFSKHFLVEFKENLSHNIVDIILETKTVNQYTLNLLVLLAAEELNLPIFGLPLSESLLLCFAQEHCTHNEMVYEDDILFYFIPGPFGLKYSVNDLELYALAQNSSLTLTQKLPKSNQTIVQNWYNNIKNISKDSKNYNELLVKFSVIDQLFKIS